ncbi:MAG: hypothetical protein JSU59_01920 [Nitrospirota bacterium]|nr:MAG: hypothetical protein JSU59_01920 [Nitrospirota bacterium]
MENYRGLFPSVQIIIRSYYTYALRIMKREVVFTLFLTTFFCACSTMSPGDYLSVRADQSFTFHPAQPIYVALLEPQTEKEQGFRKVLVSEMRNVGLTVSDQMTQETLVLFYRINDESSTIYRIPGNPGLSRLPAQWQEIHLELFSIHDVKDPGPIWEGYLKVKIKKFNAQPGDTIRPLLELVGKNYEGSPPITVYTKTQPSRSKDEIERLEEKVKSLEERIEEMQTPPPPQPPVEEPPNSKASP